MVTIILAALMSLIEEVCKRDDPTLLKFFPPVLQWHTCLPWVKKYKAMQVMKHIAPRVGSYLEAHWDDIFLDADAVQYLVGIIDDDVWPISVLRDNDHILRRCRLTDMVGWSAAKEIIEILGFEGGRGRLDEQDVFRRLGINNPAAAARVVELMDTAAPTDSHSIVYSALEGIIEGGHRTYIKEIMTKLITVGNNVHGHTYIPWNALIKNFNADTIDEVISIVKTKSAPNRLKDNLSLNEGMKYAGKLSDIKWLVSRGFPAKKIPFRLLAEDWNSAKQWLLSQPNTDKNKVKKVDRCIRAGIMSAATTPDITLGKKDRSTLVCDALMGGYTDLYRYLSAAGDELPAIVPNSTVIYNTPELCNVLLSQGLLQERIIQNACRTKNIHRACAATKSKIIIKEVINGYKLSTDSFIIIVGEGFRAREECIKFDTKRYDTDNEKRYMSILWSVHVTITRYKNYGRFIASTGMRRYMQRRFGEYIHASSKAGF